MNEEKYETALLWAWGLFIFGLPVVLALLGR